MSVLISYWLLFSAASGDLFDGDDGFSEIVGYDAFISGKNRRFDQVC